MALARAVYADTDIVLMDDPLSALDADVRKRVFEQVIVGELKAKTRILASHDMTFLSKADRILVMDDGKIVENGSYEELIHDQFSQIHNIIDAIKSQVVVTETDDPVPVETVTKRRKSTLSAVSTQGDREQVRLAKDEDEEQVTVEWVVYLKMWC